MDEPIEIAISTGAHPGRDALRDLHGAAEGLGGRGWREGWREILDVDGRRAPGITEQRLAWLGLDWVRVEVGA